MGPAAVNVAGQDCDPDSLLSWMERLIRRRRETPEIVFGDWSLVPVSDPAILAKRYDWGGRTSVIIHNLAARWQKLSLKLDLPLERDGLIDLFGAGDFSVGRDGSVSLALAGLWVPLVQGSAILRERSRLANMQASQPVHSCP